MTLKTLGINFQLILVIVTTAIAISIVDNIMDAQRAAEQSAHRENLTAGLDKEQQEIQQKLVEHIERVDAHANTTKQILEGVKQLQQEQQQ